jgi:hypothetical protein
MQFTSFALIGQQVLLFIRFFNGSNTTRKRNTRVTDIIAKITHQSDKVPDGSKLKCKKILSRIVAEMIPIKMMINKSESDFFSLG